MNTRERKRKQCRKMARVIQRKHGIVGHFDAVYRGTWLGMKKRELDQLGVGA